MLFGSLLFATRATEYAASPFFLAKMGFVGGAAVNALALRAACPREALEGSALPQRVRLAGGFSLIAWLGALTLGRLVGYF